VSLLDQVLVVTVLRVIILDLLPILMPLELVINKMHQVCQQVQAQQRHRHPPQAQYHQCLSFLPTSTSSQITALLRGKAIMSCSPMPMPNDELMISVNIISVSDLFINLLLFSFNLSLN